MEFRLASDDDPTEQDIAFLSTPPTASRDSVGPGQSVQFSIDITNQLFVSEIEQQYIDTEIIFRLDGTEICRDSRRVNLGSTETATCGVSYQDAVNRVGDGTYELSAEMTLDGSTRTNNNLNFKVGTDESDADLELVGNPKSSDFFVTPGDTVTFRQTVLNSAGTTADAGSQALDASVTFFLEDTEGRTGTRSISAGQQRDVSVDYTYNELKSIVGEGLFWITARLDNTGEFSSGRAEVEIGGQFDPALVSVQSCAQPTPQEIGPGDSVNLSATVRNENAVSGYATVEWYIVENSTVLARRSQAFIRGGDSATVTSSAVPSNVLSGGYSGDATIRARVQNVSVSRQSVLQSLPAEVGGVETGTLATAGLGALGAGALLFRNRR